MIRLEDTQDISTAPSAVNPNRHLSPVAPSMIPLPVMLMTVPPISEPCTGSMRSKIATG